MMSVPSQRHARGQQRNRADHDGNAKRKAEHRAEKAKRRPPPPKRIDASAALQAFNAGLEEDFHTQYLEPEREEVAA